MAELLWMTRSLKKRSGVEMTPCTAIFNMKFQAITQESVGRSVPINMVIVRSAAAVIREKP